MAPAAADPSPLLSQVRAVLTAEAFAAATEIRAKANAAAKHLDGMGVARQRQEILGGMSTSISGFEEGVEGADTKARPALALPSTRA